MLYNLLAIIGLGIWTFNIYFQYNCGELSETYLAAEIGIAYLTIICPYVIQYVVQTKKSLILPIAKSINIEADKIGKWSDINAIGWLINFAFGVLIAFLGLITVRQPDFGLPWENPQIIVSFEILLVLFLLQYGILIAIYFHSLIVVCKIPQKFNYNPRDVSIFGWPITETKILYQSYLKLLLIACLLYIMAAICLWSTSWSRSLGLNTNLGRIWVITPPVILITYFTVFTLKIRSLLPRWKEQSINKVNNILDRRINENFENFKKYNQSATEQVNELLKWRDKIRAEDINIFDWQQILSIIGLILIPLIKDSIIPITGKILSLQIPELIR